MWNEAYVERQNARENAVRQLAKFNLGEMARFLSIAQEKDNAISAAIRLELVEDLDSKYRAEIEAYETAVRRILTIIAHTSVGSKLLSMIRADAKIFIIPADWTQPLATTSSMPQEEGGGIRIHFNPTVFRRVFISDRRAPADEAEDTLFHELVHAMRMSNDRYGGRTLMDEAFGNTEEFIATQFENVFHAARRRSDVYGTYRGGYLKRNEMYQYLIQDPQLIRALKFFLQTEPLAKAAVMLHQPEYNPFRDYKALEKRALKQFSVNRFEDF